MQTGDARPAMWGIHNDKLGMEPFEQGFISIGWDELSDLRAVGGDANTIKTAVRQAYPAA